MKGKGNGKHDKREPGVAADYTDGRVAFHARLFALLLRYKSIQAGGTDNMHSTDVE
jgi:hypothetical protein